MDKELFKAIKRRFFALRNGAVADRLRHTGSPYKIIFGLMIPEIEQIAKDCKPSVELAEALWSNVTTRESRLMAVMVYPQEAFSEACAKRWAAEADTVELVDLLCFRLVRNMPYAERLAFGYAHADSQQMRYFAFRVLMNLLALRRLADIETAYKAASAETSSGCGQTAAVCRQITDEIEWMRDTMR